MFTPLFDELLKYSKKPKIPFHMPGHTLGRFISPEYKKFLGKNIFKIDLTELENLDNLMDPVGVIKHSQANIANIFDVQKSYFLVNGSTGGLIALILSVVKPGDKILVARNCHRSVVNGIILSGVDPVWIMPEWLIDYQLFGKILSNEIEEKLSNDSSIKAVILTNPTYEGVVSDVKSIGRVCEKYNVSLIVDEAHGGHCSFSDDLPESSVNLGASAVVQSTHKTCGSLTQSSILHLPHNSNISQKLLEENLKLIQTTSPSYLLLSSLESSINYINSPKGRQHLNKIVKMSKNLQNDLNTIDGVRTLYSDQSLLIDPTKVFITIDSLSGDTFSDLLENKHNIAIEGLNELGILLFVNVGSARNDLTKLLTAVKKLAKNNFKETLKSVSVPLIPNISINPKKAFYCNSSEKIKIDDAIGRISRYPVVKYPPGICVILPGELITQNHLGYFNSDELIEVIKD